MGLTHKPKTGAKLTGTEWEAADAHEGVLLDANIPPTIARDAEVTSAVSTHSAATDPHADRAFATSAVATEAALARNADNLTSGTVADARIASTIARDSEVTAAVAALSTVYQPLDSDLTAIAALTTTSYGRALLALADAAAARTALGLGTAATTAASAYEVAGAAAAAQAASQPVDSDLTAIAALTTTSFGRSFLALADAAAARTNLGVVIGTDVRAQGSGDPTRASLGLATTDSPQFAGVNVGAATDTTITRTGAGDIAVEGNALYRAGGTDVPIADGGTGASTKAAAFDALSPMTTVGDLIIGGASGTGTRLAAGATSGHVLTSNGSGAAPSYQAAAGGGGGVVDPIATLFGTPDTAYEFATSSFTGLTGMGSPTTEDANTTIADAYYVAKAAASGTAWMGRYSATPATPFTAITQVLDSNARAANNGTGLFVGVATPGKFQACEVGAAARTLSLNTYTAPATYSSTQVSPAWSASFPAPYYIAVVVNSTTSLEWYISQNGYVWWLVNTTSTSPWNPSLTVGSVGIGQNLDNGTFGMASAFGFLRIWNSAKTILK